MAVAKDAIKKDLVQNEQNFCFEKADLHKCGFHVCLEIKLHEFLGFKKLISKKGIHLF